MLQKKKSNWIFNIKATIIVIGLFLVISFWNYKNIKKHNISNIEINNTQQWALIISGNSKEYFHNAINSIQTQNYHSAPRQDYKKKFQVMCIENILTCIRINFDGNFSYQEKYFYFASTLYISNFLNQNLWNNLFSKTIKEIKLKKDSGERRWYATNDYIEINLDDIHSYREFIEILTHESGHIIDLWIINWTTNQKDKNYTEFNKTVFSKDDPSIEYYKISRKNEKTKNKYAEKEQFCSRYGMTDPFEDFSECLNLYINHNQVFKEMAKNNQKLQEKYKFIYKILNGHYLSKDEKNAKKNKTSRRPRDTTKI